MKRYFLILLLVLLPIQFSWAIAGAYCAHEEAAATHFGHHQHKHDEPTGDGTKDDGKHETKKIQLDIDCDYCHHVPSNAIAPASPALAQPGLSTHIQTDSPHYSSHISDLIPRPDWSFRA
ncbi:cation efflux protein, CzcI family [Massilia sp. GCM10023247]|uniref:cation efflux protein, CzcI family n=1 Tax=Massilia sp. GCM10023247 TaxID=3252643 RepID=UPI00360F7174